MRSILFIMALAMIVVAPAWAEPPAGIVEKVSNGAHLGKLDKILKVGDAVKAGDTITTSAKGVLQLRMSTGDIIVIGPGTKVRIDQLLRSSGSDMVEATFSLLSGFLRFAGDGKVKATKFKSKHATISIRGTVFDLSSDGRETVLFVEEGVVDAETETGRQSVEEGSHLVVVPTAPPRTGTGVPDRIKAARAAIVGALGALPGRPAGIGTMRIETSQGAVTIALNRGLDPSLRSWLGSAVKAKRYDGVPFSRVVPGKLVQTGALARDEPGPEIPAIKPGKSVFDRGTVGIVPSGAPGQETGHLFITLARLPHLDNRFPVLGTVGEGIETLEKLAPGEPPIKPDTINGLKLVQP